MEPTGATGVVVGPVCAGSFGSTCEGAVCAGGLLCSGFGTDWVSFLSQPETAKSTPRRRAPALIAVPPTPTDDHAIRASFSLAQRVGLALEFIESQKSPVSASDGASASKRASYT